MKATAKCSTETKFHENLIQLIKLRMLIMDKGKFQGLLIRLDGIPEINV